MTEDKLNKALEIYENKEILILNLEVIKVLIEKSTDLYISGEDANERQLSVKIGGEEYQHVYIPKEVSATILTMIAEQYESEIRDLDNKFKKL